MSARKKLSLLAAALCLAALLLPSAVRAGNSWVPLGPELITDGQAWPGRIPVTGRINVVVPNPKNLLGDIWIGSATGGVWRGAIKPNNFWKPMTDQAESLAVGAIALDDCSKTLCGTVWVGTGENSIRRDTQFGRGILKGQWTANGYEWTLLGEDHFSHGAVTKIVLDPTTSGDDKVLFAALSTGETSNGSHSTVTTGPPGFFNFNGLGIWRSKNAGLDWKQVLHHNTPATDLEMDPQDHKVLFAGLRNDGLYRSLDGGDTWEPMSNGIPQSVLDSADWPEIAVFRTPDMKDAILYAVLGECPHPHEKKTPFWCSPAVYASNDSGDTWVKMHSPESPPPKYGEPLTAYTSYTHALTIHPTDPTVLWYGGINLYRSDTAGITWKKVGNNGLHPDHHQVVVFPANGTDTGVGVYDVSDGGFFVGDGDAKWTGKFQQGLAVTQFLSVSPELQPGLLKPFIMGGTQDNGTNHYQTTKVWEHLDDGDSASTLIDLDDSGILYDTYVGLTPRRCADDDLCKFGWPSITTGLDPDTEDVSWYPPMVQGPTAVKGQHPLYIGATELFQTWNDGDPWTPVPADASLPWPLGGTATIPALNDIRNPITAIAVAPSNPDRLYIGFYDGQVFTTANGLSALPVWTQAGSGLPHRPVTSIAVHPANESTAFAAFAGFGSHSVYRTTTAGASWIPLDDSVLGNLSYGSVDTLAIELKAPYAVWAGTDDGLYRRDDADSLFTYWYRNQQGLPNVAVYDLEIGDYGKTLYAGTHGRGVWRLSLVDDENLFVDFNEAACCGYIDLYDPAPFISMAVSGFEPLRSCTVGLYEGSRLCAASATDADGATLSTDEYGFLVAEKPGYYAGRLTSWACQGGACAGGVPYSRCAVSEVEVTCGKQSARAAVHTAEEVHGPASTRLGFAPTGRDGSFTLTPTIKKNGGLSTPLCAVRVSYAAADGDEQVLARAAEIVNSDESCRRSGVTAELSGSAVPGTREDEGPVPFRLALQAPEQTGVQLVTEVTASGRSTLSVGSYGSPRQESLVIPRLEFAGRAAGGRVEVTAHSPLGTCAFGVDTAPGDAPETVAAAVQRAFLDRPAGSSELLDLGEGCLERQNARDVKLDGAELRFGLGRQITVDSTDPGLSFTIGSDR